MSAAECVVTSMSRAGWERYGARCVASFAEFGPSSVPLVVYGDEPFDVAPAEFRLTSSIQQWKKQQWVWRLRPVRRPQGAWIKPQSYIWDVTFAVKVFVWADVAERMQAGILTWIDADTELMAPIPEGLFANLLGGKAVAYMGRQPAMHPETGYVSFRLPEAWPLLRWMRAAYQRNAFVNWADGWTDCHALRAGLLANPKVTRRDLTSRKHRGQWRSSVDAMALSPLRRYLVHHKGKGGKRVAA